MDYPGKTACDVVEMAIRENFWGAPLLNINLPMQKTSEIRFTRFYPDLAKCFVYPLVMDKKSHRYVYPFEEQKDGAYGDEYDLVAMRSGYISITPCQTSPLDGGVYQKIKKDDINYNMAKILLLTSAGMQVKDEILKLLSKPTYQTTIAHITTAAAIFDRASWMEKDKKAMLKAGFQVEDVDITGKTEVQLRDLLNGKDIIYVQGGDPYYLLKQIKDSGFDRVAKEFVNLGEIYIGVSAGSYIVCPTIEMALWKKPKRNRWGLTDNESAMNLVPFLVCVHFKSKDEEAIKKGMMTTTYPVKVITDNQAILI